MSTKLLTRLGLLAALGLILQLFSFPLPFFPPYLRYDAAEIPALCAAFAIGPWAGVLVDLLKNVLSFLIGNAPDGLIGITANFLSGGSYAYMAGKIYQLNKNKKNAIIGLVIGSIVSTIVMVLANYFVLLPLYGVPSNEILPMIVAATIPFNLLKAAITGFITLLLYKKVSGFFETK